MLRPTQLDIDVKVRPAEFRPLPAEAAATGSPALWAVAGSCGAVALLLLAVLAVLLYTRLGPRTGQESKKVSRVPLSIFRL